MSPDNVILENDDIHQATIIDFGIAKDLDASSATIVGDGFAGKLNYVAPEQLGDFGREVGPWTDVYSLGLVILAVAQGKEVDMSGSLVDAIDKRRKGPDLSAMPGNLRPLVRRHAAARSQGAAALDGRGAGDARAAPASRRRPTVRAEVAAEAARPPEPVPDYQETYAAAAERRQLEAAADRPRRPARFAAALAVIWYLTDGTFGLGGGRGSDVRRAADRRGATVRRLTIGPPVEIARVDDRFGAAAGRLHLARHRRCPRRPAGRGRDARRRRQWRRRAADARQALTSARIADARPRFRRRRPDHPGRLRRARQPTGRSAAASSRRISTTQTRFELAIRADGDNAGGGGAGAIEIDVGGAAEDFALVGIQPSGEITLLLDGRDAFQQALANPQRPGSATSATAATGSMIDDHP